MATLVDSPIQLEKGTLYKRSSRNCKWENVTSTPEELTHYNADLLAYQNKGNAYLRVGLQIYS